MGDSKEEGGAVPVEENWRSKTASDDDFLVAEQKQHSVLKREVWSLLRQMGVSRNRFDSSAASSSTAEIACFMRHLAHLNPHTPAGDALAHNFIHEEHKFVAQNAEAAEMVCEIYDDVFPGLFGHVAARTQVYDALVAKYAPHVEQVVILGAGFDSRAYRMPCLLASPDNDGEEKNNNTSISNSSSGSPQRSATRNRSRKKNRGSTSPPHSPSSAAPSSSPSPVIFEVDAPGTQAAKKMKLKDANIENPCVTYVPVNFECDNFAEKLLEAGFDSNKRTLWTWEFVSPYLTPEAVSSTFESIWKVSEPSSLLAYDYCYKNFESYHGGAGLHRAIVQSGEALYWTVAPGKMRNFLAKHNLALEEEYGPADLERDYLTNAETKVAYRSFGFYAIVLAKCVPKGSLHVVSDEEIEEEKEDDAIQEEEKASIMPKSASSKMFEDEMAMGHDVIGKNGMVGPIRNTIISLLTAHTEVTVPENAMHKNLIESTGLDSLQAVAFARDIHKKYGIEITESFILNPKTSVDALSEYIAKKADTHALNGHANHSPSANPMSSSVPEELLRDTRNHIIDLLFKHTETRVSEDALNTNLIESTSLDSLQAVAFARDIQACYGVEVSEAYILNPKTSVNSLTDFISKTTSSSTTNAHTTQAQATLSARRSTSDEVRKHIIVLLLKHTEMEVHESAADTNLIESTGLDSLQAVAFAKDVQQHYGVELTEAFILSPTTTVNSLAAFVASTATKNVAESGATDAPTAGSARGSLGNNDSAKKDDAAMIQDACMRLRVTERAVFSAFLARVDAKKAADMILLQCDDSSIRDALNNDETAVASFVADIEKALQLGTTSIPDELLDTKVGVDNLILFLAAKIGSQLSPQTTATAASLVSYHGIFYEPLLRLRNASSPKLVGSDEIAPATLGPAQRIVSGGPRFLGAASALVGKILSSRNEHKRQGLIDADEATAKRLGWSTNEEMSWHLLQHDSRLLLYPDVGMEIDFPYKMDTEKMIESLKLALAFFPAFGCRLTSKGGRITAIRGESDRLSGARVTTRKYSKSLKPFLKDMFVLGERKMVPGDADQPWYGQKSILVLKGGNIVLTGYKKSYWLHLVSTQKPFVSSGMLVDIITDMPVTPLNGEGGSRTGTRLTIAVNHTISDAYGLESFLHIWSKIHRTGGVQSVLDAMTPRNDILTRKIGMQLLQEEKEACATKTNLAHGVEGLIYALSNDAKASGFKGVLKQKALDEFRKILPEEKRRQVQDADLVSAWLWMNVVNSSVKHWKADKSSSRWYPSVSYGKSLRYMYPELQLSSGNLTRFTKKYCPVDNGIGRKDLDSLLPLSSKSPIMADVILRLNAERKQSYVKAMETATSTGKLPGYNVMDEFCYKEDRDAANSSNHPCIFLNDMSAFSTNVTFDENKSSGHVFFSTEGLVGKMGIHGKLDNGCLSLSVNKHLFSESKEYKHGWFIQFACNPGVGVAMNCLLSHNR